MEAGASSAEGSFLVAAQGPDVWRGEMGQVLMVCTDRAVTLTPGSIVTSGLVCFQRCVCLRANDPRANITFYPGKGLCILVALQGPDFWGEGGFWQHASLSRMLASWVSCVASSVCAAVDWSVSLCARCRWRQSQGVCEQGRARVSGHHALEHACLPRVVRRSVW